MATGVLLLAQTHALQATKSSMRGRQGLRTTLAPAFVLACVVALMATCTGARVLAEGLAPAPAPASGLAVGVAGTQAMDAPGLPGLPDIKVCGATLPMVSDTQA